MEAKFVKLKSILQLQTGDIIRHVSKTLGHESLVVTANYGDHVTAVRTQDVTNPTEWLVLRGSK